VSAAPSEPVLTLQVAAGASEDAHQLTREYLETAWGQSSDPAVQIRLLEQFLDALEDALVNPIQRAGARKVKASLSKQNISAWMRRAAERFEETEDFTAAVEVSKGLVHWLNRPQEHADWAGDPFSLAATFPQTLAHLGEEILLDDLTFNALEPGGEE
jgi:hypothetical protein